MKENPRRTMGESARALDRTGNATKNGNRPWAGRPGIADEIIGLAVRNLEDRDSRTSAEGRIMWDPPPEHPLRRLFAGYTEHTFQLTFGLADPPLIDYLSGLLCRFLHADAIHRLKNSHGLPIEQVAEMMAEVADLPPSRSRREIHRHIGDFALFWTGVYPEALRKIKAIDRLDYFVDYCQQGKRSYAIAGEFHDEPYRDESAVLLRLADEFELCAYGLQQVRREWERDGHAEPASPRLFG
jgi:hypothetical protein